jgi:hypothetical protein
VHKLKEAIVAKRTSFQDQIEGHLVNFKETQQYLPSRNPKKKWQYFSIEDNLYPPTKHSFLQFAYDNAVPFHDFVNHVRSSQIFAVNMFYPVLSESSNHPYLLRVLNSLTGRNDSSITAFWFEYSPDDDCLGEWPGKEPAMEYVTASDVVVETSTNGRKAIYFFEVKFTEYEFSPCGGYTSRGNSSKFNKPCQTCGILLDDPSLCYLHTPQPRKSPRKYFDYFNMRLDFPGMVPSKECPFISNHQCLRNHALARATKGTKDYEACYFGLVYHDKNLDIAREWKLYTDLTANSRDLLTIPASQIVTAIPDKTYKQYFERRYQITKANT